MKRWIKALWPLILAAALFVIFIAGSTAALAAPDTGILNGLLGDRTETVDIVLLLTILTLLPSILLMMTAFTRIIIVLSFLRNALGTQQAPPNQVLIGLALFLTLFVMYPVIDDINVNAYTPYVEEQITTDEALDRAMVPIRSFMLDQTFNTDMVLFYDMAGLDMSTPVQEAPMHVVIPAFLTSEIKRAFTIGFYIFIPFIVVDMVVASTLMSMGMMMLPPMMISLPFKLLLFVVVDGWNLVMKTLLMTFG